MNNTHFKQGFSLIELLIVIFIVALVYFLGFGTFSISSAKHTVIKPKKFIADISHSYKSGKLMCIDMCDTCIFKPDLYSKAIPIKQKIDLKKDTKAYTIQNGQNIEKIDFGKYHGHKICMLLDFYTNGSHSKLILEDKKHIYFINSLDDDTIEVNSLEDAKELWIKDKKPLYNLGDFY